MEAMEEITGKQDKITGHHIIKEEDRVNHKDLINNHNNKGSIKIPNKSSIKILNKDLIK